MSIKNDQIIRVSTLEDLQMQLSSKTDSFISLPENAIFYMGLSYIEAMLDRCKQSNAQTYEKFILDVADDHGTCIKGFQTSIKNFLVRGSDEACMKLKSIALKHNKTVYIFLPPDIIYARLSNCYIKAQFNLIQGGKYDASQWDTALRRGNRSRSNR